MNNIKYIDTNRQREFNKNNATHIVSTKNRNIFSKRINSRHESLNITNYVLFGDDDVGSHADDDETTMPMVLLLLLLPTIDADRNP